MLRCRHESDTRSSRLQLISLAGRVNQHQRDVIDYLEEENRVLREQLGNKRLRLNGDQRRRLAVMAKKLGGHGRPELKTLVTLETLLAWHRTRRPRLATTGPTFHARHDRRRMRVGFGNRHSLSSSFPRTEKQIKRRMAKIKSGVGSQ